MGAGTGVLSVFAARAGAARVFAIERTNIAEVARRVIADNGVADRVEVMQVDLENANLPTKVDVVISEWSGRLGRRRKHVGAAGDGARSLARTRRSQIVPARVTVKLAPACVAGYDEAARFWRSRPHDLDLAAFSELTANETFMTQSPIALDDLFAAPQAMWSHERTFTCTLAEADRLVHDRSVVRRRALPARSPASSRGSPPTWAMAAS